MPVTIESGIDTPDVTSHFRGAWTLYFYVPRGTRIVGGWASRVANWAPKISGQLIAPDGSTMLDFGKLEDGFFKVDVPEGADGGLWKFQDTLGQLVSAGTLPLLYIAVGLKVGAELASLLSHLAQTEAEA